MKKIWLMYLACFVLIFTLPICIVQIGKIGVYDNLDSNYPIAKLKSTGKITTYIKAEDKVEEVELEDYLRGVLAAEMPVTFPLEALKAQAVAARTYIINKIVNAKGEIPEHHGAQVCTDSAHCKAWMSKEERLEKWPEAERDNYWNKITAAVQDTAGEIMTYDGKPVTAVFYAISSGKTERAADVWGSDVPYLQSVDSPVDKNAPGFESTVSMSVQEFKNKMSAARPEAAFRDVYKRQRLWYWLWRIKSQTGFKNNRCAAQAQRLFFIGAFRRGNKPVVEPEEEKSLSKRKTSMI